ncbi:hypothetical protein M422DRAFT_271900 [Sphaerobolus stellatus SS14]|uniref:Cupin type-2 domain-containing protein n=1 Tax=Sphaerobolus stellatus (strain SS14) TaxID=990650 RepID=A0A0C9UNU6_SPHS4|nr:hypothetical protein M422DRAFT_271900 [Sphaerobolus stellatus SS14]
MPMGLTQRMARKDVKINLTQESNHKISLVSISNRGSPACWLKKVATRRSRQNNKREDGDAVTKPSTQPKLESDSELEMQKTALTSTPGPSGSRSISEEDNLPRWHQKVWWIDVVPADVSRERDEDPTKREKSFEGPADNGSVGIFVHFGPGSSGPMHFTKSLDYGIIIEGELELELDNGEKTVLKIGDVIVQRETKHAWHNPHPTQLAKIFICIVSANGVAEKKD